MSTRKRVAMWGASATVRIDPGGNPKNEGYKPRQRSDLQRPGTYNSVPFAEIALWARQGQFGLPSGPKMTH